MKIENEASELAGKGKEQVGRVTGDEQLQAEGRIDQEDKSDLEQASKEVEDVFRR